MVFKKSEIYTSLMTKLVMYITVDYVLLFLFPNYFQLLNYWLKCKMWIKIKQSGGAVTIIWIQTSQNIGTSEYMMVIHVFKQSLHYMLCYLFTHLISYLHWMFTFTVASAVP